MTEDTPAARMRAYRATHPDYRERERAQGRARGRALRQLARRHGAEFLQLLDRELARERKRASR